MFYLLENNRIIDSEIPYVYAKWMPFWEAKDGYLFAKDREGKLYHVIANNKIKNQSKNLFDLIEEGDW